MKVQTPKFEDISPYSRQSKDLCQIQKMFRLFRCQINKKGLFYLLSAMICVIVWYNTEIYFDDFFPHAKDEIINRHDAGINSTFLILIYEPSPNWSFNKEFPFYGLEDCPYTNCEIQYNKSLTEASDVVFFYDRTIPGQIPFNRPAGQTWIFYIDESPIYQFNSDRLWKRGRWVSSFNWTASYDPTISDIFFPYGEIRINPKPPVRDFSEIARKKTKDAVWIVSHCAALSKRDKYINTLRQYISIDVYGKCGQPLDCMDRSCLSFLNHTYKYYLAFENSLCPYYYTEKIFENYNSDIVIISRGGVHDEISKLVPENTFISAFNFTSADALGKYLKNLSLEDYVEILERKNKYLSYPFKSVFHKAMCNVCERINNLDKYRKTIPDLNRIPYFGSCT